MVYRLVIFIFIDIGLFFLLRTTPPSRMMMKKQSVAKANHDMMQFKRHKLVDKKINVCEKFRLTSEEMLKVSNSKMSFTQYLRIVALFSVAGIIMGLLLSNMLLSCVLAVGMALVPLQYLKVRQSAYVQTINEQMEMVLSLITNSYLQSGDIIKAVNDNIHRIEQPFQSIFREFIAEKTFIDSNMSKNIRKLKRKIDNSFFDEWCNTLILCQQDRELMYVLPTIVEKMSDIKQIQAELNTQMYNIYKDHISVTLVVAMNIPLMKFLNAEWYRLLTQTLLGQIIVALTFVVIFFATAYVIKVNKPVSVL